MLGGVVSVTSRPEHHLSMPCRSSAFALVVTEGGKYAVVAVYGGGLRLLQASLCFSRNGMTCTTSYASPFPNKCRPPPELRPCSLSIRSNATMKKTQAQSWPAGPIPALEPSVAQRGARYCHSKHTGLS